MATSDFRDELIKNANQICRPGYGILAADESTGTIGKKFDSIGLENTEANRQRYRNLLFTAPGIENHISGVILYDETARQNNADGVNFCQHLTSRNILPGIKLDKGVKPLMGTNGETATQGIDDLGARCTEYYNMGIRFAKWRAVLKIGDGLPSNLSVYENTWTLARYASICQQHGLVPIVEPEILSDGTHDINTCAAVTERVWAAQIKALHEQNVMLEGCLIKPNMVTHGQSHPERETCTPEKTAAMTLRTFRRTVPASMVGIVFLSGGQSELEATLNLNAMNKFESSKRPWAMSFSYGRALQNTCIKTWNGSDDNVKAAQDALLVRCKANSDAQLGQFVAEGDQSGANEKLVIENYVY